MDQVSISLHREARVKRMIGILRVLIAAAIATAVYFLVAGMVAGGVALLGMMGVAWVVSEKSSCARPVREPFAALRGSARSARVIKKCAGAEFGQSIHRIR